MGIRSGLKKHVNCTQIKALLWKDVLVRIRQPWLTAVQFLWPILIFLALYTLRLRFGAKDIDDCQFPTRQLPSSTGLLPFFQSYICTIENECSSTKNYNEISTFDNAPITPVSQIMQLFLNEEKLYRALVDLPNNANFLGTITAIATHPRFSELESGFNTLLAYLNKSGSPFAGGFDVNVLWSDDAVFSKSGEIFCGKPFPHSSNIRLVDRVLYQEDFNGANQDEINVMPTNYCKQLYLDVTNTNNGKITWNYIKPIIQGKFLYGPVNEQTDRIIRNANETLLAMNRLKDLVRSFDYTIQKLRVEGDFQNKFLNIVKLSKSPFVQLMLANFDVDQKVLDSLFDALLHDKMVADLARTIANIFECFSVDRFIGVETEKELEDMAIKLNEKRLFFAGIFFNNHGYGNHSEYSYKIRMDVDNTPVTLESRNRFWFPGPLGSFELDMRYHRGFIQLQHMVDHAITKTIVERENERQEQEWKRTTTTTTTTEAPDDDTTWPVVVTSSGDVSSGSTESVSDSQSTEEQANTTDRISTESQENTNSSEAKSSTKAKVKATLLDSDFKEFRDERQNSSATSDDSLPKLRRKKRQFDFNDLFGTGSASTEQKFHGIDVNNFEVFTKQFPYPKYRRDDFVTGLYLAQSIQLAFFFALIVQVSNAVRSRIWTMESGNSTLMRIMGMEKSSENIAWILTTLIELAVIFFICEVVLYTGGVLQTTSRSLLYAFLLLFGGCVIAFCYMMSSFFKSASIGSVSTVILFLMTYMPYIIIISLGSILSSSSKIIASLSFSTAFCYAWRFIMRLELQQRPLTFSNAFHGSFETNEFKFAVVMIAVDLVLYIVIGYLYERYTKDEFKFHEVEKKDMELSIGGALQNCSKKYDVSDRMAIENVSIVFRKDFITCLLGRNGAGKSTIIKLLTGQIAPSKGHVYWPQNWDRITAHEFEERVGLCPQNNILIPNLTAREHLELYVRIKTNGKGSKQEVDRVMQSLQFGKHEHFYSQHLSGGFKRRLNVAVAFISSPNLVILDEPCCGVDTKARKNIWDLISVLRQGRAVVLATHYLDEAEHLSDSILILNEGKVVAEHDPETLKEQFTQSFELHVRFDCVDNSKSIEAIKTLLQEHAPDANVTYVSSEALIATVPYRAGSDFKNYSELVKSIEDMERSREIHSFRIVSSNLEQIFNDLVVPTTNKITNGTANGTSAYKKEEIKDVSPIIQNEKLTEFEVMKNLLMKRFLHFKRNYRLILCVLILPTVFELIAMGFMTLRPPGEHDVNLKFSRGLYSNSTEFYSSENGTDIEQKIYSDLTSHCAAGKVDMFGNDCKTFDTSQQAFRWILNTTNDYPESRYGGITMNASRSAVWFNNNGYHAMPVFLNELNTANLRSLMNNSNLKITTYNHPLKLGEKELTASSILQQVADAGISLILLVAFSLVVAGSSIYIVSERLNGEKLQQKLCDVTFKTYWGVSFIWDYTIYIVAVLLAVVVFKIFDIPVYTAKDNLYGICLILLLFGFATIPMVHVFEKLFSDASVANMYILCMNIIIALSTVTVIILFDILGESSTSEKVRDFLNRAFLVLPQHALADGLVEICKNHVIAEVFERYYINTYKSPIASNLLLPHYIALITVGVVFSIINYVIESGMWRSYIKTPIQKKNDTNLETIAIASAMTRTPTNGSIRKTVNSKKDSFFFKVSPANAQVALKAEGLCKTYKKHHEALRDVTFNVKVGECFGLLGSNGAGKSTIFGILSGELAPTSGTVSILNREEGIAYCPQSNALDNLLTVEEIIHFYLKLRRITNIDEITEQTLQDYHILPYRNVLVKNLSGGNRRKLSVAVTCFGSTSNVLMDEPTSDMDPVTRSIVYESINRLLLENRSVILTSHTITEIDRVCDRIGVMRQGQMIVTAPPHELKTMYGNRYSVTVYYDQIEALTIERDIKKLISGIEDLIVHSHCLQFRIKIQNLHNRLNNGTNALNNNNKETVINDGMIFSELLNKLHELTIGRGIIYTITECLLDQAFERVLDVEHSCYTNSAYLQSETPT